MNCKHCNAELAENSKFCSNCGKPVAEELEVPEETTVLTEEVSAEETAPEAEAAAEETVSETMEEAPAEEPAPETKKTGAGKIALAVVAVVVVLAVLIAVIAGAMSPADSTDDTTDPADVVEEATEGTIPPDGNPDDATCKGSYTGSDEEVAAAADTVVATMGDRELTVEQLQIYYWTEFVYFMQDYSYYASYFGLDYTQPLDTQLCSLTEETMTWQQYFLACALDSWQSYQAMTLEAEANGLEMDEELRAELEKLPADLDEAAVSYGLADAAELLQSNFGPGATVEGYVDFWELYYTGYEYYNDQYEKLLPTAEEVEAFYAENEATYTESGVTKDGSKYVDVRHILIMPEGGTYDEETYTTTYSEEEWSAAETKAQEILDMWLAGDMTEESFAALANEHSEDTGSNTVGGLYEDVYVGEMVEAFENWCFDEARQIGDYGLVKTEYGYHIMYFVGSSDVWFVTAENDLIAERSAAVVPAAIEKYPVQIDYSAIVLGLVEMS